MHIVIVDVIIILWTYLPKIVCFFRCKTVWFLVGLTEALTAVSELRPVVGEAITGPWPCMASPLSCSWQAFSLQYVSQHLSIFTQVIPGQKFGVAITGPWPCMALHGLPPLLQLAGLFRYVSRHFSIFFTQVISGQKLGVAITVPGSSTISC